MAHPASTGTGFNLLLLAFLGFVFNGCIGCQAGTIDCLSGTWILTSVSSSPVKSTDWWDTLDGLTGLLDPGPAVFRTGYLLAPPFNWGQQQQGQQFIQNLWCPLPLMDFLVGGHLRCVPLILVLPGRSIGANHLRHWHLLMTLGRCRGSVLCGAFDGVCRYWHVNSPLVQRLEKGDRRPNGKKGPATW
jgi:hypothetical protein